MYIGINYSTRRRKTRWRYLLFFRIEHAHVFIIFADDAHIHTIKGCLQCTPKSGFLPLQLSSKPPLPYACLSDLP